MTPIDEQLAQLRENAGDAVRMSIPGGGDLITVAQVPLPPGWSKPRTSIYFVAPIGYPLARPDCFWADVDLRLATSVMPQSTNIQPGPGGLGTPLLWFSWHPQTWHPSRDTLLSYFSMIRNRLNLVR